MTVKVLYRYESRSYSVILDAERELYGSSDMKLVCDTYDVTCTTPKGWWIWGKTKWVGSGSGKRFAHPTKEQALEAYKHRKLSFIRHATARLRDAKKGLRLYDKATNFSRPGSEKYPVSLSGLHTELPTS